MNTYVEINGIGVAQGWWESDEEIVTRVLWESDGSIDNEDTHALENDPSDYFYVKCPAGFSAENLTWTGYHWRVTNPDWKPPVDIDDVLEEIGDMDMLQTTVKDNIVNAINELNSRLKALGG